MIESERELVLGVVVVPEAGLREQAINELRSDGAIELGPAQAHRLPGCICTAVGCDEEILSRLESLPSVLKVEVVFAHLLEEELAQ